MIKEARESVEGTSRELSRDLTAGIERAKEGIAELDTNVRELVRERPVAAVVGAIALGFVVGRLLSRR